MRKFVLAQLIVITLYALLFIPESAKADHPFGYAQWPSIGWSQWANSAPLYIGWVYQIPQSVVDQARTSWNNTSPPAWFIQSQEGCAYTAVCIGYYGYDYGYGVMAAAWLYDTGGTWCGDRGNVCQYGYVDIVGARYFPSDSNYWYQVAVIAHEMGHVAGLADHTAQVAYLMWNDVVLVCSSCGDRDKFAPAQYYTYGIYAPTYCDMQAVKWEYNLTYSRC